MSKKTTEIAYLCYYVGMNIGERLVVAIEWDRKADLLNNFNRIAQEIAHDPGLFSAAVKIGNSEYYPGVVRPIDREVWSDFLAIHELFFNNADGYLKDSLVERKVEAEEMLLRSLAVAHYAHQLQTRASGEPYLRHPSSVALDTARTCCFPPASIAKALEHDVIEDSNGYIKINETKILNPYPVSYADIARMNGQIIADGVLHLTKFKDTQKRSRRDFTEQGLVKTRMKLVDTIADNTDEVITKINDRVHNMQTIKYKPLASQINTAEDTRFYIGIAQLLKLPQAQVLSDMSFKQLYPKVSKAITQIKAETIDLVEPGEVEQHIFNLLGQFSFDRCDIVVRKPGIAQIASEMAQPDMPGKNDVYFEIDVALPDEDYSSHKTFIRQAIAIHTEIGLMSDGFDVPDPEISPNIGYAKALNSDPGKTISPQFLLLYKMDDKTGLRVKLNIYRRSDYYKETTAASYLDALDLLPEDKKRYGHLSGFLELRRKYAKKNHDQLLDELDLRRSRLSEEDFTDSFIRHLPNEITVTGQKRMEKGRKTVEKTRPMTKGSTVMDYVLTVFPLRWREVREVYVNDKKFEFSTMLPDDCVIWCKFGKPNTNCARISWLTAAHIKKEEFQDQITSAVEDRIAALPQAQQEIEKEHIRFASRTRLLQKFPQLESFNLDYYGVCDLFPGSDPMSFIYQYGLGKIDFETETKVLHKLENYWENLTVVAVRAPDRIYELSHISRYFSDIDLSIRGCETWYPAYNPGQAWILYRFHKGAVDYTRLSDAKMAVYDHVDPEHVSQSESWIVQFESQSEFENHRFVSHPGSSIMK